MPVACVLQLSFISIKKRDDSDGQECNRCVTKHHVTELLQQAKCFWSISCDISSTSFFSDLFDCFIHFPFLLKYNDKSSSVMCV